MRLRSFFAFAGLSLCSGEAALAQNAAVDLPTIDVEAGNGNPAQLFQTRINEFDQARDQILLPKAAATSYNMDYQTLQNLPLGTETPIDKVLLQAPGVSYDSAVSNPNYHIRNEYANVQYRINGILLPEGVSGLGAVLETGFIGNLNLLTGALPAQYGLRTAGVVDITTRSQFTQGGTLTSFGGSFGTASESFDYGGVSGNTQYFVTGRYLRNNEGLENSAPSVNAIHDTTQQEKFFGYVSTLLGDDNRLTFMSGLAVSHFQIPNNPNQQPLGDIGGMNISSTGLNENEYDNYFFNILALQTHTATFDTQFSLFSRYTEAHFVPDIAGDLAFNDVASNVARKSLLNGFQFDGSYKVNDAHIVRAGFAVTGEQTWVNNTSTVLPLDASGTPLPTPETIVDATAKLGWNIGGYVQDEWKLNSQLTLNAGLRFDQLYQFVSANQLSPRLSIVYKPFDDFTLHAGYARYFTPPMQAQATPSNIALFNNTTLQSPVPGNNPVLPERSHYFDVGIDKTIFPGFTVGADVFYKIATDQIDDGQFGQAIVLTQFNYAQGFSRGVELKAKYYNGGWTLYGNVSVIQTEAKDVVSNQYLFTDPVEFAFIQNNYHYTDDAQLVTASGGAAYKWNSTTFSVDGIFGSGLRSGFANLETVQPYTQFNLGITQEFDFWSNNKPLIARFSVVNVLDTLYLLRSGDGIGEFAPQYGPRRGFFLTLSQKF
jgi:outer membrane receptor protein involved in Fe transport